MSLPYFPMYPTDFEAKTSHLTLAEDGAYNRLLRICWMTPGCTMPADEAWIMRRARAVSDHEQEAVRAVLAEFFTIENGRYSNAKLMRVFREANEAHEKRKNAGARGGKAKSLKTLEAAPSNAKAMPKQPEPEPELYKPPLPPKGDDGFELFWSKVPRKIAKGGARKAFKAALKKASLDQITNGMEGYAASVKGKDPQYIAHPATWLTQERWADDTKSADTRTWRDKPESEWTNKDRTEWAKAML